MISKVAVFISCSNAWFLTGKLNTVHSLKHNFELIINNLILKFIMLSYDMILH